MSNSTLMEAAFQNAVSNLSKKKQLEVVTDYIYSKYSVFKKFKPLALGIDKELVSQLTQFNNEIVLRFLSIHCKKLKYIKNISKGGTRFNINNKPQGKVTESEQKYALQHPILQENSKNKNSLK